LASLFISN